MTVNLLSILLRVPKYSTVNSNIQTVLLTLDLCAILTREEFSISKVDFKKSLLLRRFGEVAVYTETQRNGGPMDLNLTMLNARDKFSEAAEEHDSACQQQPSISVALISNYRT